MDISKVARSLGIGALTGLAGVAFAAEIKSTPKEQVWIADGQTQYTLKIHVNNEGLNGDPTRGVQARVNNPFGFQYVSGSASVPPIVEDFFSGNPMFTEWLGGPGFLNVRLLSNRSDDPVDSNGFFMEQRYVVPVGTPSGSYSNAFPLTDTKLKSSSGGPDQLHTVSADKVWVFQSHSEARASCLSGPGAPYVEAYCDLYDADKDGDVDLRDYATQDLDPSLR